MVRQTVCREGYKMTKDGRCIVDKKYNPISQRQSVCPEGYKITKDGRCIVDKPKKSTVVKEKGQRQTVCYEGYKMTKDGRCIKDKNYKTIVVPMDYKLPKIMVRPVKTPSYKAPILRRQSSVYDSYIRDRMDEF
jgi:flagellar basal body rod protein FlgG